MPPTEGSVVREGCYSSCFLHVGITALWRSFSVGGKRQTPSITLIGEPGAFFFQGPKCVGVCSRELPLPKEVSSWGSAVWQILRPSASAPLLTPKHPSSQRAWSNRKDKQNKPMLYFSRDAKEDCVSGNLVSAWILSSSLHQKFSVMAMRSTYGTQNLHQWATTWKHAYCPGVF